MLGSLILTGSIIAGGGVVSYPSIKMYSGAEKYAQACGTIYVSWNRFVSSEKIFSLISLPKLDDVLKSLSDTDYAPVISAKNPLEFEAKVSSTLRSHFSLIKSQIHDPALIRLVELKHDFYNFKLLVKHKLAPVQVTPAFSPLGSLPPSLFTRLLSTPLEESYSYFPDYFKAPVQSALEAYSKTNDTEEIDFTLDRELFKLLFKFSKSEFFREFFSAEVDIYNILTLFRCRNVHKNIRTLERAYIPFGQFKIEKLKELFALSDSEIVKFFNSTPYKRAVEDGFSYFKNENSFVLMDKKLKEHLFSTLKTVVGYKGVGPELVFFYFVAKEQEAENILSILKSKYLHMDEETTKLLIKEINV